MVTLPAAPSSREEFWRAVRGRWREKVSPRLRNLRVIATVMIIGVLPFYAWFVDRFIHDFLPEGLASGRLFGLSLVVLFLVWTVPVIALAHAMWRSGLLMGILVLAGYAWSLVVLTLEVAGQLPMDNLGLIASGVGPLASLSIAGFMIDYLRSWRLETR